MDTSSEDTWRTHKSLLIRLRQTGDQEAWEQFQRRYGRMIRGWCGQWFPREVDDKVQDVYCKLVERLKTFEYDPAKGRFRGWLKTLTHRLMADFKEAIRPSLPDGQAFLDEAEAREDLFERLAAEFDLELLEIARQQVRARVTERTWRFYEETAERGRKPAEVARELGMSTGAVYQPRYNVISELRQEIENREILSQGVPLG